jgi:hypothetical protein
MKHLPIIILGVLLLMACGNKSKTQTVEYDWDYLDSIRDAQTREYYAKEKAIRDSVYSLRRNNPNSIYYQSNTGGGYTSGSDDKDYDNMRGFDPASEDDMEDNGMTRYMENNDEEGWD